jgi:uncharacterized protein (TIGR03067 family)
MRTLLMFAVLAVAVPDRPDPDKDKGSDTRPLQEQLQGEWQVIAATSAGKPQAAVKPGEVVFIFTGNRLAIRRPKLENVYEFTIDPTKSPPGITIQAKILNGKETKSAALSAGIVKIEGDVVSICVRPVNGQFASNANTTTILWQAKRAK